jgi:hypothetical protein
MQILEQQSLEPEYDVYLIGSNNDPRYNRNRVYSTGDSHQCSCDYFKDYGHCTHVRFIRDVESGLDESCCPIDAEDEF